MTGQTPVSLSRSGPPCDRPVPAHNEAVSFAEPEPPPSQTHSAPFPIDPSVHRPVPTAHGLGIPAAKSPPPATDRATLLGSGCHPAKVTPDR